MNNEFQYKETVLLEPWMKRGAKVITSHGSGTILYVRKSGNEVFNFNVRIWMNQYQFQDYLLSAWAVKQE